jgi:hypothetical protein
MKEYDPHELKSIRRGVSAAKVIAAYRHFGSFRKVGELCGIAKGTVKQILERYGVDIEAIADLPEKASYNVKNAYSKFAKWHKANAQNPELTHSVKEMAKLAGVSANTVKCYFYRRRASAAKLLSSLPDLRKHDIALEDIEGSTISTANLKWYKYIIDRYSEKAALQGETPEREVIVLIPSIEKLVERVKHECKAKEI